MANWDKQQDDKSWKRSPKVFFGIIALLIAIVVIVAVASIRFPAEAKYSYLVMDDKDILIGNPEYNSSTNITTLEIEVLIKNNGNNDSGKVFIEVYVYDISTSSNLFIYKNESVKKIIKADKTERFYIDIKTKEGTYDLTLRIWENDNVVEYGNKRIKFTKEYAESKNQYSPDFDEGKSNVQQEVSKSFIPSFEIPLIAIAFALIIIFGRKKTKK